MSLFIRKKEEVFALTGIAKLSTVGFFAGLAAALISTVWALYLDSFFHSIAAVGFITSFLALISFGIHFAIIPLIEKSNKAKLYASSMFFYGLMYIILIFTNKVIPLIIFATIITILQAIRIATFGIIIKDKSKNKLTRNEGIIYTFFNIAFLVGPLVAGFIAENYSINFVFALSSFFIFLSTIMFKIFSIKDAHISKKIDGNPIKNFVEFFKNKNRTMAYFLSGGVNLWWSLIYVFIPLYMVREGLHDLWVGYFLFAVVIPLISLEYLFAKKIKTSGFKKMFKRGYAIVSIIAFVCFFIENIYLLLGILVLGSVGMAMLEPTTESYFLKILKRNEENRFYPPYNTTIDMNYFIGKLLSSTIILILPFRFIFLLFALFMLILFFLSGKIKDIRE
ncbi:MAG: MFS transporter [archaeon]